MVTGTHWSLFVQVVGAMGAIRNAFHQSCSRLCMGGSPGAVPVPAAVGVVVVVDVDVDVDVANAPYTSPLLASPWAMVSSRTASAVATVSSP